jgi:hypothetical protein
MRSADINGEKLASSIENMLSAADESVDTAKILKTLDSVRVTYRHKSKSGGSLYEEEQRINQLRLRAEKAREDSLALDGWEQKLERAKSEYAIVKEDFEHKDALLSELNKVSVLKRFGELEKTREKRAELDDRLSDCEKRSTFEDFRVDRAHTAEIKLSAKAFSDADKMLGQKKAQSQEQKSQSFDEQSAALGKKIEVLGGVSAVMGALDAIQKKLNKSKVWFKAMIISTVTSYILFALYIVLWVKVLVTPAYIAERIGVTFTVSVLLVVIPKPVVFGFLPCRFAFFKSYCIVVQRCVYIHIVNGLWHIFGLEFCVFVPLAQILTKHIGYCFVIAIICYNLCH